MDNNESGTVLYRNVKCCADGNFSSEVVKNTVQCSDAISGNQLKSKDQETELEPKSPFNKPNIFVCPIHGGRHYSSKNQCYQYKTLLRRIKSLLDEINAIRKNETTGICEFCMRYNSMGRCKRCEILRNQKSDNLYESRQQQHGHQQHLLKQPRHIANVDCINKYDQQQQLVAKNYVNSEATNEQRQKWQKAQQRQSQLLPNIFRRNETDNSELWHQQQQKTQQKPKMEQQQNRQQQRFMIWISKVKQFLFSVLESEGTQHKLFLNKDPDGTDELTNLLNQLKMPLNVREPYIRNFSPSLELLENLNESNNIFKEVVQKLRNEKQYSSAITMEVMPCPSTCKYFTGILKSDEVPQIYKDTLKEKATSKNIADSKSKVTEAKIDLKMQIDEKAKTIKTQDDRKAKRTSINIDSDSLKKQKIDQSDKKENKINQEKRERGMLSKRDKNVIEENRKWDKTNKREKSIKEENRELDKTNRRDKSVKEENREWDKTNKRDKDIDQENKESDKANKRKKDMKQEDGNGDMLNKRDKDKQTSNKQIKKETSMTEKDKGKQTKKEISMADKLMSDPKPPKLEEIKEIDAGDLMLATILLQKKNKELPKQKFDKPPIIPDFKELPIPKHKERMEDDAFESVISESIMECKLENIEPTKMIMGTEVVPMKHRSETEITSVNPVIFKVKQDFQDESEDKTECSSSKMSEAIDQVETAESKSARGGISYKLSNKEFIQKGWTLLPTTKIMRKMNVYKMEPAKPQYDWFKNHQSKRYITYDTGEKLSEMDDDGNGRWYYKNGRLALNYYSSEETNSGHRYVVYSSGEKDAFGRKQPVTVLASFDYVGNGVVYDHYGNERLKYNQTEGVIIDDKIGTPGNWKWHSLNDPPELHPQFIDTYARRDDCIEKLLIKNKKTTDSDCKLTTKEPDLDMIAIELENILKDKANKLLQDYKPFQIKMKALKINDQFSLKVLGQSTIYLIFRDGQTSMKLNLGMLLISNEIVDSVAAELFKVETPYDSLPPKSQSIADIQKMVEKARYFGRVSGCSERKE